MTARHIALIAAALLLAFVPMIAQGRAATAMPVPSALSSAGVTQVGMTTNADGSRTALLVGIGGAPIGSVTRAVTPLLETELSWTASGDAQPWFRLRSTADGMLHELTDLRTGRSVTITFDESARTWSGVPEFKTMAQLLDPSWAMMLNAASSLFAVSDRRPQKPLRPSEIEPPTGPVGGGTPVRKCLRTAWGYSRGACCVWATSQLRECCADGGCGCQTTTTCDAVCALDDFLCMCVAVVWTCG